jgi:hypothetical protein
MEFFVGTGCSEDTLSGNPWPDRAVASLDNTCSEEPKIVGKSGFSVYFRGFLTFFVKKLADSARIFLIMRKVYVIMRFEVCRSLSVNCILEISDYGTLRVQETFCEV